MTKKRDDLPERLYLDRGMFRYRAPNCKPVAMGRDREKAIEAANIINGRLSNQLTVKVNTGYTLGVFLELYLDDFRVQREWAAITWKDHEYRARVIRKSFLGSKLPGQITVLDINNFLSGYPACQSNNYRSFLALMFKYAISLGHCPMNHNPADATMRKKMHRERQRLTLEQFQAVRGHADAITQCAMDLALLTLQRRRDLADLKWASIRDGHLYIIQHKTSTALKITVTPQIQAVLDRCRDGVISPYVLHQGVKTRSTLMAQPISPDRLSRHFRDARKQCGWGMTEGEAPTFHEIRALGADLLRQAGVPEITIQRLLGHSDIAMTQRYLDGHEVNWDRVPAVRVEI